MAAGPNRRGNRGVGEGLHPMIGAGVWSTFGWCCDQGRGASAAWSILVWYDTPMDKSNCRGSGCAGFPDDLSVRNDDAGLIRVYEKGGEDINFCDIAMHAQSETCSPTR